MPGMSLIQPTLCVLNVPALLTLRRDGCQDVYEQKLVLTLKTVNGKNCF